MRKVLRALGHVTREGVIALKGRAACELNTADELVVGELLMEGVFQDLDAAVAVALLSCLCHTEKAKEGAPPLRGALQAAYEQLRAAATTVARACVAAGLPVDEVEYVDRFNPDLMEVLFQWTNGAKFVDLTKLTDAFEGTIIRVIRRLDELLRQLASAAFAVGNFELKAKFDDASEDQARHRLRGELVSVISRWAAVVVASNDHSPLPRGWGRVVRCSATYPARAGGSPRELRRWSGPGPREWPMAPSPTPL